jgi:AcrR family transcriptional regulator
MNDKREARKQRRRDANRLAILEAAEKVFSELGYGAATMDNIAAEAQFSKATLYRYFDGKNEVFSEIIQRTFREAIDCFAEIRRRPASAEARLRDMVGYALEYTHYKRKIARILWLERASMKKILNIDLDEHLIAQDKRKSIPEELRLYTESISDDMRAVMQEGIESGEFRAVDPETATAFLGALMRGFHFQDLMRMHDLPLAESTDLVMDFFLNGVRKIKTSQKGETL